MRLITFIFFLMLMLLVSEIGFYSTERNFEGSRDVASINCNDLIKKILKSADGIVSDEKIIEAFELKRTLWGTIRNTGDFEGFDSYKYLQAHDQYSKINFFSQSKVVSPTPKGLEEKLALIDIIQIRFMKFENGVPSLKEELENLNEFKLKKLSKLFKNFDGESLSTREKQTKFVLEYYLLLKGAPVSVFSDFGEILKGGDDLFGRRVLRILQEEMLNYGLKAALKDLPVRDPATFEKQKILISKFFSKKIFRLFALPFDLPAIDNIKIPDELLVKILNDGLDVHNDELLRVLKNQSKIDHYNRFRKVYRAATLGVAIYLSIEAEKSKKEKERIEMEKASEENKEKIQLQISEISTSVKNLSSGVVEDFSEEKYQEEQFQRILKTIKEKYKRDPSAEEIRDLREAIFTTSE